MVSTAFTRESTGSHILQQEMQWQITGDRITEERKRKDIGGAGEYRTEARNVIPCLILPAALQKPKKLLDCWMAGENTIDRISAGDPPNQRNLSHRRATSRTVARESESDRATQIVPRLEARQHLSDRSAHFYFCHDGNVN